jgi:hypothetical protein
VQRILEVGFVFIFIVDTRKKKQILKTLDSLDKKVETMLLDANEIGLKHYLNNRLAALLREEKVKWYQRANVKEFLEGDSNTKYF